MTTQDQITSCITKKAYDDPEKARKFAHPRGLRVYACTYCGQYHLTSRNGNKRHAEMHRSKHETDPAR